VTIPRIIHQTAPSRDGLDPEIVANIERLKAMNPGWEYRFYDDAALHGYIAQWLKSPFRELVGRVNPAYGVVLADLFRYLAIYREGGVYLDIKSGLARPLDAMLRPDDEYLLSYWPNRPGEPYEGWGLHRETGDPRGELQQWHVIGTPRHPFLRAVLARAFANIARYRPERHGTGLMGVLRLAGPICYTRAIRPLMARAPHRLVESEGLGLRYVVYSLDRHLARPPGHYTRIDAPIVLPADAG
jgi:mannosyltransferase OCH1-like enzyme